MWGGGGFWVLQAFIDDSCDPGGTFVLAGHIASAESWAAFARDWEELLPFATPDKDGRYRFKMSEMAINSERMERSQAFFRVIEKHVLFSLSVKIDQADLRRAQNRIWIPGVNIEWGWLGNAYMVAFRSLLDTFHNRRDEMRKALPADQKIDFIFDKQTEAKAILSAWDYYINSRADDIRQRYGATPRFENDMEFLPLQAADFWAWWVRKWWNDGMIGTMTTCDFGTYRAIRKFPRATISASEDEIVETIRTALAINLSPGDIIYDVRFSGLPT